jgi:hypothetical protein
MFRVDQIKLDVAGGCIIAACVVGLFRGIGEVLSRKDASFLMKAGGCVLALGVSVVALWLMLR